ncbi:hypothetical protein ACFLRI_04745 [Bacteroidota bacterium]
MKEIPAFAGMTQRGKIEAEMSRISNDTKRAFSGITQRGKVEVGVMEKGLRQE